MTKQTHLGKLFESGHHAEVLKEHAPEYYKAKLREERSILFIAFCSWVAFVVLTVALLGASAASGTLYLGIGFVIGAFFFFFLNRRSAKKAREAEEALQTKAMMIITEKAKDNYWGTVNF